MDRRITFQPDIAIRKSNSLGVLEEGPDRDPAIVAQEISLAGVRADPMDAVLSEHHEALARDMATLGPFSPAPATQKLGQRIAPIGVQCRGLELDDLVSEQARVGAVEDVQFVLARLGVFY